MKTAAPPIAEVGTALPPRAPDPYRGTPLGVEAAWCPDGIDVTENEGET